MDTKAIPTRYGGKQTLCVLKITLEITSEIFPFGCPRVESA